MPFPRTPRFAEVVRAFLRVAAGLLFMQHGAQKLFGLLGGFGGQPGNTADLVSQMGLAGVLEIFGGALMVVGLVTRPVAALLFIEMIWAYVQAHLPQGPFPLLNGGEPALLFAIIWLFFVAAGPGRFSVDRLIGVEADPLPSAPRTAP